MCLILFAHRCHPRFRLVLAANRDEFFDRPTQPARWWSDLPEVFAGQDLAGGGTWIGVDRRGRWAAVTNIRDPGAERQASRSRGLLVRDFLAGTADPRSYLQQVAGTIGAYRPFNLLAGDTDSLAYVGSRTPEPRLLDPGVYGLSNAALDTPWPKVSGGKTRFRDLLKQSRPEEEELFALLRDETPARDEELPETGVPRSWERRLSPRFVRTPDYGTRSSTLLLVDPEGRIRFRERIFGAGGSVLQEVVESFRIRA